LSDCLLLNLYNMSTTYQVWVTSSNGKLNLSSEQGERLANLHEVETEMVCASPDSWWINWQEGDRVQLADGLYAIDFDRDEGLCPLLRLIAS